MIKEKAPIIVFDFDGVLYPNTLKSINLHLETAEKMGLRLNRSLLIKHWGKKWETDLMDIIEKEMYWAPGAKELFIKKINAKYKYDKDDQANPYPEIKEQLKDLPGHKAVVSSREKSTLGVLLSRLEVAQHFSFVQAAEDCSASKPDPRVFNPLFDYLQKNNHEPERIIYVGDTIDYDFQAVKGDPRIDFVGITSCLVNRKQFQRAGAKFIIDNLGQLKGCL